MRPQPKITALSPERGDSGTASVRILFTNESVPLELITADTDNNCCLDGVCGFKCLAECRIYSPGRAFRQDGRLTLGENGKPSCALPSYGPSRNISCSVEVQWLEIEVVLDGYFLLETMAPSFGCLMDTVVAPPSGPP